MALTNKLYESTRRTAFATATTAALALTGLASLVTPSYSADQPNTQNQAQETTEIQFGDMPRYSKEQLKPPIWPKEMSEEERKNTQGYYQLLNSEEKIEFKEMFSNPKAYMKKKFKTKEEQTDFQNYFNIELMGILDKERNYMEGILNDGLKRFPWKSNSKDVYNPKANDDYTLSRRLWQYFEDKKFEKIIIDMPKKK